MLSWGVVGWSWDSDDRPSFKDVGARLETISNSLDINAAVEHELQRHRIRMPPPPPKTPPPSSDHLAHRRNSSLERFDKSKRECLENSPSLLSILSRCVCH